MVEYRDRNLHEIPLSKLAKELEEKFTIADIKQWWQNLLTTFKKRKKDVKIDLKPLDLEHLMYIHQTGSSSRPCLLPVPLAMSTHLKRPWTHQILKSNRVKRRSYQ